MAKKFADLAAPVDNDPERRARVDQHRQQMNAELAARDSTGDESDVADPDGPGDV